MHCAQLVFLRLLWLRHGGSSGGAVALPSAGLGPYVWTDITVGDEKVPFGPERRAIRDRG